jgi:hypothetical protein
VLLQYFVCIIAGLCLRYCSTCIPYDSGFPSALLQGAFACIRRLDDLL